MAEDDSNLNQIPGCRKDEHTDIFCTSSAAGQILNVKNTISIIESKTFVDIELKLKKKHQLNHHYLNITIQCTTCCLGLPKRRAAALLLVKAGVFSGFRQLKEVSFCHKLAFSNPYIFATL